MAWIRTVAQTLLIALLLTSCGVTIPSDPNGTLDRVTGGELRVGLSPNGDLVRVDDGEYSGREVELVERFADSLDAEIEWTVGSEESLVRGLENSSLDLVIAGITDQSPWVDRAAPTRPYAETPDAWGVTHKLVMLVPMGENAFLSTLERFLDAAGEQA
jgi:ABC-type amino acid transport substrate-binding protein